jgi:central kinetochore subunit Mal2/MCM21
LPPYALIVRSPLDSSNSKLTSPSVEALRHRRSLLSHALLSSRKLKSQLARSKPTATLSRAKIESAQQLAAEHEHDTITSLHRTCAGITAFRVQDPDPNAVDSGNVLGVRFDIFSAEKRAFKTPYYVLLNQPKPGSGQLKIHKHTVPIFIPLQALAKRYLPYNAEEEDEVPLKGNRAQDLPKFVRALRKELVAHHKRVAAYELLKRDLGRKHGVDEVKMLDATAREIEILFSNKVVARLRVATDGKIEKVAIGPSSNTSDAEGSPERSMKTYREIKKVIEGVDGRIEDLATRLQRRGTT